MKNKVTFFLFILLILSLSIDAFSQDFKTIRDGIEYAELTREIDKLPVRMNLLRLDLAKVRLDVAHAMDEAIGVETTSSIAARYGAFAAINAGFFRLDNSLYAGDPAGALMIDGELYSEPVSNRTALLILNDKDQARVRFMRLDEKYLPAVRINGVEIEISGVNRERKKDELIAYYPVFHRTTLTDRNGVEVIVEQGRVSKIVTGEGSSPIPQGGYVLSAVGNKKDALLKLAKIGTKVKMSLPAVNFSSGNGDGAFAFTEDAVGGIPQLIRNGKIDITWEEEKAGKSFVETKHPRTAVAKLKDGKFLMITVDGRSESSGGIGLNDLAALLLEFGATDAMNLDGGGSTTMFLDGKVVNHPSDKEGERKVSDAILVFPRNREKK
jgi:hypothetical protein